MKTSYTIFRNLITVILLTLPFTLIAQTYGTIGSGSSTATYPLNTYYEDSKTQMLYTATELQTAGFSTGLITHLAFDISSFDNKTLNNFKIRLQNTNDTSLDSFITTNWTTVYDNDYTLTKVGWDTINLNSVFYWDGISNLLIQVCHDNTEYYEESFVYCSIDSNMVWYEEDDYASGCGFSDGWSDNLKPNILFGIMPETQTDIGIIEFSEPNLNDI
ncbi:MAG: hypothetical protein DRI86_07145, partial [Bacteroidetes bacterium]